MNRIVLLSLVVLSPIGTIGTIGVLAPMGTGSSIGLLSVVGSKVSRAEARTTKEFDWIDFSGLENVCFCETASSLEGAADENLLDLVETIVEDRTLKLRFTNSSSMGVVPEASSVASAGVVALNNNPISGEAGLDRASGKETRLNWKSRFKMPETGIAPVYRYSNLGVLSARNGIRSYPRQPRVSKTVVESGAIASCSSAAIDLSEAGNESNNGDPPAGETELDEDDDH